MQLDTNEVAILYEKTEPLLKKVASTSLRKYRLDYKHLDDLESVARFAFIKATNNYSTKKGSKFNTYFVLIAIKDIETYVQRYIFKHSEKISSCPLENVKAIAKTPEPKSFIEQYVESLNDSDINYLKYGSKALLLQAEGYKLWEISKVLQKPVGSLGNYISKTKMYIREHYSLAQVS